VFLATAGPFAAALFGPLHGSVGVLKALSALFA
jgi:hypothetical protein